MPPISEPMIYLLAFGYGMGPLIKEVTYFGVTVPYFDFITPGMIAVGVLFQSFFEGAYGTYIRIRYQMTWQALLTAPVTFFELFLGDWFWAATRGTLAGVLTALTGVALDVYPAEQLLYALPLILLGSLLFSAMGMFAAGMVKTIDQLNIPVFLLVVPMFAFCGTYFPRDVLPKPLFIASSLLPLAALVDLLRAFLAQPAYPLVALLTLLFWIVLFAYLSAKALRYKLYS